MLASVIAPTFVWNIMLNERGAVRLASGLAGLLGRLLAARALVEVVGAEAQLAGLAVDQRVGETGDVAGGLPDLGVEDDRGVEQHDVLALLGHRLQPPRR